jgi:HK97 family phage major capsid protein
MDQFTEKEFNELVEKVGKQSAEVIEKAVAEKTKGMITKEQMEERISQLNLKASDLKIGEKSIEEILREQGTLIATMKDNGDNIASKSLGDQFAEQIEKRKSEWDAFLNKSAPFSFEVKAADTITRTSVPTAGSNFVPAQQLVPGVIPYKTNEPLILRFANVMRTTAPVINWVDETAGEGDAGWTAEGAAKPLMDVNVTVRNTTVKKVAVVAKASEESLADIPFLQSLLEGRMRQKVATKIDEGLLSGDGTGETPTGLAYYAPGFTSTEMDDSIVAPNQFDALAAAATQIIRANFKPTVVFINPVDWFKMMHKKDSEERYVLMALQLQNGQFLQMTAVQSNVVTPGSFIMGDMSKFHVAIREDVRYEAGWENDDFRKNLRSFRCEARLAAWVSENEKLAFVQDTYQDVMDAIDAAV